jgi:hypothetical protein
LLAVRMSRISSDIANPLKTTAATRADSCLL